MHNWIDGTLYPDTDIPDELPTLGDRVDFLARLCSAWDFGLLPDRETVEQIRKPDWLEAVDATQLVTSPTYHLVRSWHGLPTLPYLGQQLAYIRDDPNLEFV
jgi:hypothetical protein